MVLGDSERAGSMAPLDFSSLNGLLSVSLVM